MAKYKSDQPVYLSNEGRYIMAGEEFQSDHVPGTPWQPLDKAAKSAVVARDEAKAAKAAKAADQSSGTNGTNVDALVTMLTKLINQQSGDNPDGGGDSQASDDCGGGDPQP